MIQDPQEYLDKWEREYNPFYPSEMRWDRVKVNRFLKDWKEQCNIANVVGRSEQLFCSMAGEGFCLYEYENGKCKVEGKCTNHTTK